MAAIPPLRRSSAERPQVATHCFFWSRFSDFAARFSIRLFAGFFLVSFLRSLPLLTDFSCGADTTLTARR